MSADLELTKEMMEQAASAEQQELTQSPAVLYAQNQYLNNRVVILRALVNHQKNELDRLRAEAPPSLEETPDS